MRIFFIHGFGELPTVFDKIAPHIDGEKIFLNVWDIIGNAPQKDINALVFAKKLIADFGITANDVVIGHSMGGFIAYHIKHVVGCRIVQIASWTKPDRVITPIKNRKVAYWLIRYGFIFNALAKRFTVNKIYKGKPSEAFYTETFDRLRHGNRQNVLNQMHVVIEPVAEPITVTPDLRIHAKGDRVIRYPKGEECVTVSGDHFTLWTNPEEVYEPIVEFLQK